MMLRMPLDYAAAYAFHYRYAIFADAAVCQRRLSFYAIAAAPYYAGCHVSTDAIAATPMMLLRCRC